MRVSIRTTFVFAAALALASLAAAQDRWEKTYSLAGKPTLRIETNDAHVRIETGAQKQITARVLTEGWRIADDEVRVIANQSGNRIELEVRIPKHNWGWHDGRHRSVKIEINMPREADLDVRTGDGHVNLQPLSGDIRVHTGDGHITATGLKGAIRLTSGDGHIECSQVEGEVEAKTGDGHIHIDGQFRLLNLHTGDGAITANVERGSAPSGSWNLDTGDGSITLRLPADFGAQLDAHTNDGRITTDFPVAVSGRLRNDTLSGKLNAGGPRLTLRTGDGSIRIQKM